MKTLLTFTLFTFLMFFSHPSVLAQRRTYMASADCRSVISTDLGAFYNKEEGPSGLSFGFNIENIVSKKFTFNFNVKDFLTFYRVYQPIKNIVEHRIVLQPSMSFYPLFALHGFYINMGCGGLIQFDNRVGSNTQNKSFIQIFPDAKLGFQSIASDNFAWNLYIGSGVFIPKIGNDPIFFLEGGIKLGLKL
jgi:hypothetical protein